MAFPMGESGCDLSGVHQVYLGDASLTPAQTFRASRFLLRVASSPNLPPPLRGHSGPPFAKLSLPLCQMIPTEVISVLRPAEKLLMQSRHSDGSSDTLIRIPIIPILTHIRSEKDDSISRDQGNRLL